MPDVRRNGSMEIDLKLHGDKIKLESRPVSREGASRPVSALTLYNTSRTPTPKEEHAARRRPRSADDNKEPLSSAELLKSLVSQPIVSWRNGSAELSPNYKSDDDVLNAPCQLTPGLTGKPPLPMIKREKKVGNGGNGEKEEFDEEEEEEGSSYAKELEEIASRLSEIETSANTPDLIADNQIKYQNWIADPMVAEAEKRTDLILNKIRQQQNDLSRKTPREYEKTEINRNNTFIDDAQMNHKETKHEFANTSNSNDNNMISRTALKDHQPKSTLRSEHSGEINNTARNQFSETNNIKISQIYDINKSSSNQECNTNKPKSNQFRDMNKSTLNQFSEIKESKSSQVCDFNKSKLNQFYDVNKSKRNDSFEASKSKINGYDEISGSRINQFQLNAIDEEENNLSYGSTRSEDGFSLRKASPNSKNKEFKFSPKLEEQFSFNYESELNENQVMKLNSPHEIASNNHRLEVNQLYENDSFLNNKSTLMRQSELDSISEEETCSIEKTEFDNSLRIVYKNNQSELHSIQENKIDLIKNPTGSNTKNIQINQMNDNATNVNTTQEFDGMYENEDFENSGLLIKKKQIKSPQGIESEMGFYEEDSDSINSKCKFNSAKEETRNSRLNYKNKQLKLNTNRKDESNMEVQNCKPPLGKKSSISFEKFFSEIPPIDLPSEKIITHSERPLVKPTKTKNAAASANVVNRKQKMGVKFSPKIADKKGDSGKGKFTAKRMRVGKDCSEKAGVLDEEISWMSRPEGVNEAEKEDAVVYENKEEIAAAGVNVNEDDDEIAAILEVLEAESQKSQSKIQTIKKIVSTELNATINSIPVPVQRKVDIVENNSTTNSGKKSPMDENNISSKHEFKTNGSTSSVASSNYKEILCFLDEVDKSSTQSLNIAKDRIAVATKLIDGTINLDSVPRLEDLLTHAPAELASEVVDLNLRLKEKSSAIRTLQEELSSLREQVIRSARQTERIVKDKLRTQKEEADAIVRRHQKFIDQLIGEKKALGTQCENLVGEMRMLEERFAANAKAAEHRHQVEMQKMKDMHVAGEKIRRERWLDSKTQKIKEMTVKSIEPEIQAMTVRHEQELADLRSLHKREIEDIELKNARKTQQQCEAIRAQMTEEREKALAHEREVMRQRYESMVESEEKSYQDQRKRLMQEHAHRMEECEAREEAAVAEKERALKQLQDEYEDKIQCIIRRHANEVKISRESAEMEMETWRNNCRKQLEMQLAAKEASLREQLRKERDREIELVIERLESESNEARSQLEAAYENRIRRLRDKYEKEIKDLELSENEAKVKYAEMKGRLLENEELVIGLKAANKNFENQLKDVQETCEKLTSERQSMKVSLEQEVREEISSMEKEIEKIKEDRDAELQQVYSRVKVAVARKDETITELSRDNMSLKEKCKYLENMLEQQRKEYLIK